MKPALDFPRIVPRHYLRPGRTLSSPRRVITLDTETRWVDTPTGRDHTLRVWVARLDVRHTGRAVQSSVMYRYGTTPGSVADQVAAWTRTGATTWLYCHNLSFDMTVTGLPALLVGAGWQITASHITDSPTWWRLRCGRRRLVLVDSHAIWPAALAAVAGDMGQAKADLPANDDDDLAGWWERCERDVTILADALLRAMAWWDTHQMGRWTVTGAGLGWSAYKTRFLDTPILIDPDHDAMAFEQRATYGGRREAYRLGEWTDGEFLDWDFSAAYPSIAARHSLPVARLGRFDHLDVVDHSARPATTGVLAECTVMTTVPVAPCRYGESVFYPIGTYRTVLTSPEIDLVMSTGGHVVIGRGYRYRLGPTMRTWGWWITRLLTGELGELDPVVRRMVKHWSRATIGRWTMRQSRRRPLSGFPLHGQAVTRTERLTYDDRDLVDVDGRRALAPGAVPISRVKGWDILYAGEFFELVADVWPDDGFPAVWAWVEAWCRVHLWQAMSQWPDPILQCDTDGWLSGMWGSTLRRRGCRATPPQRPEWTTTGSGSSPAVTTGSVAGLPVALKGSYRSARILGPQHMVLDGQRRFPGVPRAARELERDTFETETWPGFLAQIEGGHPLTFRQGTRTLRVAGGLTPRWTLASGRTLPVTFALVDGRNTILAPPAYTASRHRVELHPVQHPVLTKATLSGKS